MTPEAKPKHQKWQGYEAAHLAAFEGESRRRDMEAVRRKLGVRNDFTEVYKPERMNKAPKELKLTSGHSLDLTAPVPDGKPWDFSRPADRLKLWKPIQRVRLYVISGSPPCTAYSFLQNLRRHGPGGEERLKEMRVAAERHLRFGCDLCAHKIRQGQYFVHGHPESAESWTVECIARIRSAPGVMTSAIGQCAYGLISRDELGEAPV